KSRTSRYYPQSITLIVPGSRNNRRATPSGASSAAASSAFDQVFGARPGAKGDPANADLGLKMTFANKARTARLDGVDVSPNHHALADRFALSDNFYCDSDQSNTGHRWVVGVYPNEWVEVNARSRIEERVFSPAPGRRYVAGSSAATCPGDADAAGAAWAA